MEGHCAIDVRRRPPSAGLRLAAQVKLDRVRRLLLCKLAPLVGPPASRSRWSLGVRAVKAGLPRPQFDRPSADP
jgi:hypothetical protein